jgi:hypothetical protein
MKIQDIQLYDIDCYWSDEDESESMIRTVAVGKPDFIKEDKDCLNWTHEEVDFDCLIFHYYDNYEELDQHLKDGFKTREEFIVTQIYNK